MPLGRHRRIALALASLVILGLVGLFLVLNREDDLSGPSSEDSVLPLVGTRGKVPDRPALAVKIENTAGGRPQTGLAQADVVFEEMVEGGLTRLMAVYHSQRPNTVGPVRSARSTDIPLLAELNRPLFAWSGANPTFAASVRAADIIDVGVEAAPGAYRRTDDRQAPYNLYASPKELWGAGKKKDPDAGPPPMLFEYRPEGRSLDAGDAEPASGFSASGAGLTTSIGWDWDPGAARWLRTQDGTAHVDNEGARVSAVNVVIRLTPYRDSGVRDSTGAVVPEADLVGEGDAWLLTDGQVQRGRWRKPDADAATTFTTADGSSLELTPGKTWVEVLPPDSGEVVAPNGGGS